MDKVRLKDFPNYVLYSDGRLWSDNVSRFLVPFAIGRVLKTGTKDYLAYKLCRDGEEWTVQAHRLVASTFIPNPDNLPEVNHKDGNKKNNCVSNLEWVSHQANVQHAFNTGLNNGEVGQGVQKGWEYGIQIPEFFMFTIQVNGVKIKEADYQMFKQMFESELNVKSVPEIRKSTLKEIVGESEDVRKALLKYVEGKSAIDGKTIREGSVFRSLTDSSFSFKVVNNQFLLKGGD